MILPLFSDPACLVGKVCLILKDMVDTYRTGKLAVRTIQVWEDFDNKYALKKHYDGFIAYVDAEAR